MVEQRELGPSGIVSPVVGMGTWRTFDVRGKPEQRDRKELVDVALGLGVRLFDSSPMYGESERVLGACLTGRRERALVATKVWSDDAREGQRQIDRALHFYEERIDLYQVHNLVAWQTWLPVLERMKASGTIRAIGITHYSHAAFDDMEQIVRRHDIDTIQVPYNALDAACAHHLLPLAEEHGIGVLVMRPFGEGMLIRRQPPAEALAAFATFGVTTWAQILLKWVLSDPRVSVAIPATSDADHLRANAVAGEPPWFGRAEREEVTRLAMRYSV